MLGTTMWNEGQRAANRGRECRSAAIRRGPSPAPERPARGRHPRPTARSEEHTSELQSLMRISYAVFCLKKKKTNKSSFYKTIPDTPTQGKQTTNHMQQTK